MVREGRVFISPTATRPQYGIGYYVTAYEVGAQVTAASSGTTATVAAGHGFAANDKFINGTDVTQYRKVTAVTSTTLTLSASISLAEGDLLVNLAHDTGTIAPNYDGTGLTIYTDMDYSNTATDNTVLTDQYGKYRYYHKGVGIWELVRDSSSSPIAVYADVYTQPVHFKLGKPSTLDEATEIGFYRDQTRTWSLGEDYWPNIPVSYFALWSYKGISGTSGDVCGISWYGAETENVHGGVGGVDSPKWFFNSTPFSQFASAYTFHFYGGSNTGIAKQALFQHYANTGNNGGVDIHTSGTNDGLELRNEDGTQYRSSIRFCRTTTAGGSTVNGDWLCGMGISANGNIWSVYDQIANSTRLMFNSSGSSLHTNASGTYLPTYVFDHLYESSATNAATIPYALRIRSTGTPAIGLGLYQSLRMPDAAGTEAQAGALGTIITDATAGALKAMTQLWSSYGPAAVLNVTHARKVLINTTTETNATAITVAPDADNHAAITLAESTANPATPTSAAEMRVYMKADKFVIQYNDGGTVRWKYLDLTGTGVTWTHTAVAP